MPCALSDPVLGCCVENDNRSEYDFFVNLAPEVITAMSITERKGIPVSPLVVVPGNKLHEEGAQPDSSLCIEYA